MERVLLEVLPVMVDGIIVYAHNMTNSHFQGGWCRAVCKLSDNYYPPLAWRVHSREERVLLEMFPVMGNKDEYMHT